MEVFCDFDGTISVQDATDFMLTRFADSEWQDIDEQLKKGAAGAIEAVVCALTLHHKVLHPAINYENADPDCDLDYTPNHASEKDVHVALSNSFGFGSNNACLVMKALS